jgi:hypothetical protein
LTLFDIAKKKPDYKKEENLERALDTIREKYGYDKVKRAAVLNKDNK